MSPKYEYVPIFSDLRNVCEMVLNHLGRFWVGLVAMELSAHTYLFALHYCLASVRSLREGEDQKNNYLLLEKYWALYCNIMHVNEISQSSFWENSRF